MKIKSYQAVILMSTWKALYTNMRVFSEQDTELIKITPEVLETATIDQNGYYSFPLMADPDDKWDYHQSKIENWMGSLLQVFSDDEFSFEKSRKYQQASIGERWIRRYTDHIEIYGFNDYDFLNCLNQFQQEISTNRFKVTESVEVELTAIYANIMPHHINAN